MFSLELKKRPRLLVQPLVVVALMAVATWAQAAYSSFDIYEYRVEGNSLLPDAQVERAVMPFMGEGKSVTQVQEARSALEKAYHDAGYLTVLVSIPEQAVDSGVVSLQVIEAPVARLRVAGSQYHLPSVVKSGVTAVAEGKVPNFNELQEQLASVNRGADMRVAPVLKPGKAPGTVEVQLDVDDQLPLHGSVELTRRETKDVTATRLNAAVRYDNLWQRGHSIGVNVQTSPERWSDSKSLMLTYMLPVSSGGDTVSMYALSSRGLTPTSTFYDGIRGNSDRIGLRYSTPMGQDASLVQVAGVALDIKREQSIGVAAGTNDPLPLVQYAPLSANYQATWLGEQGPRARLDLNAVLGLRGLLGNSETQFQAKQYGASANFTAVRGGLSWWEHFGKWDLVARGDAQWASGTLLPSERFSAGGADTVRGYLEGEASGDVGVRGSVELASPGVKVGSWGGDWRMNGLAFVDGAYARKLATDVDAASGNWLASLGTGLRLTGPRGMSLQLDLADALLDGETAGCGLTVNSQCGTKAGQWRIHLRWVMEF